MGSLIAILLGLLAAVGLGYRATKRKSKPDEVHRLKRDQASAEISTKERQATDERIARRQETIEAVDEQLEELDRNPHDDEPGTPEELLKRFEKEGY